MESVDNGEHHCVRYRADPVWRWCRIKSRQTIIRGIGGTRLSSESAQIIKAARILNGVSDVLGSI